jgi:MFS family permease
VTIKIILSILSIHVHSKATLIAPATNRSRLMLCPRVRNFHSVFGVPLLIAAVIAGICTASFYGWLPLYLPELFPTRLRATSQGFAFNFGRILAAIGTLQMSSLLPYFGSYTTWAGIQGGYAVACSSLTAIYLIGMVLIWFAPETRGQPLPD